MGLKAFFKRKSRRNNGQNSSVAGSGSSRGPKIPNVGELEQVFKKFDANGDGKISSKELGSILWSLGYEATDEELESMIREFDADGDGYLGFQEFVALNNGGEECEERYTENLRDAFRVYDIDGNGLISAEELHKVMGSIGEECSVAECRRMIRAVDSDGDGMIDFDEFKEMMRIGATWKSVEGTQRNA